MSEYKQYTLAEVATHNSNKSVWFVIHNNIYDVTEFLNEVKITFHADGTKKKRKNKQKRTEVSFCAQRCMANARQIG